MNLFGLPDLFWIFLALSTALTAYDIWMFLPQSQKGKDAKGIRKHNLFVEDYTYVLSIVGFVNLILILPAAYLGMMSCWWILLPVILFIPALIVLGSLICFCFSSAPEKNW
jgi:hypothetical protein